MIRARRDRLAAEREWDLAKQQSSLLGITPTASDRLPVPATAPGGRRYSIKSSGTLEYYD